MSLRFILGRAGSGKSELCLEEIRQELRMSARGRTILYIVPEQMTFQAQVALHHGISGSVRAQVFSFSRLAWKVLQEAGGASRLHIDGAGVHMLLRKIVEARKQELTVFQKASEQTGFLEQASRMISELKRHNVNPSQLYAIWQEADQKGKKAQEILLANKLHDLQLLYEDFERSLIGRYLDSEDYLQLLAEKIPYSRYVKDAIVYVDGFHTFTPQEVNVLKHLLLAGAEVTVALTMEHAPNGGMQELDLFYPSSGSYEKLVRMAKESRIAMGDHVLLKEQKRFEKSQSLAHLEKYFDTRPYKYFGQEPDVSLYSAANRRAEAEAVAREIRRLVRENGYRYRDIAVMVRNGHSYYDVLKTIFPDYNIPYFVDEKRSMLHHPLIELIRSALEVITGNWRYDAIFRCVKTELLYPLGAEKDKLREDMDEFENYCLSYGIQGKKWTSSERWTYRRYRSLEQYTEKQTDSEREIEDKLNEIRTLIAKPLLQLQNRFKRAKTTMQMCEALYLFLDDLKIPKKLDALRLKEEEEGNLLFASDHDQVWQEVIDLLDKCVEMLGEEKLSRDMFIKVITAGLEALQFANIPPSLDQVLVANIDRSRLANVRAVFVIGANEGVIPSAPSDEGVISDEEREMLFTVGVELAATSRQKLLEEQFVLYHTLTRASERLYVCCPLADEEGKTLLPSSLFKRLKAMFPLAQEVFVTNDVNDVTLEKQLSFVATPSVTLSYLTQQLQHWKRYGYESNLSFWWDVYNFYITSPAWSERSKRVLSSLFYENKARKLTERVSQELYGETVQGSVSRIELFQRCSYAHFIQHGLLLRERDIFKLDAPDIGQLFHAALKHIADKLEKENKTWQDLDRRGCEYLAADAMEELAPLLQKEILLSSNRHHYLKRKLQHILFRTSLILSEHAKASGFVPVGLEVPFGIGEEALPPLQFQLPGGTKMKVVGRIDRVDKAKHEKGTFLRIIDYKSSAKALDVTEVYYGLALQMLTYLDVVVENASKWVGKGEDVSPAGVLYFHIHNPLIDLKRSLSEAEIEQEMMKKFKMKGLLLGDSDIVTLMDNNLEETGSSHIISAGFKKGGGFTSNSSVASEEDFQVLRSYVRRTFESTGTRIAEGEIEIAPYKMDKKTACTFCQFKAVCQFDESLEDNQYRVLRPMKGNEALQKMREEVDPK